MTYWELIENLSKQIIVYKPMSHLYQGDDKNEGVCFTNIEAERYRHTK